MCRLRRLGSGYRPRAARYAARRPDEREQGVALLLRAGALPTDIYIADTIGEIGLFYALTHVAFRTMELVYRIYCADTDWRDRWSLSETPSETPT